MAGDITRGSKMEEVDQYDDDRDIGRFCYLQVQPHNGGILDLLKYCLMGGAESGVKFLESSHLKQVNSVAAEHRWIIVFSIIVRRVILLLRKPMKWIGILVESTLNLFSHNCGFLGLLINFVHGNVVVPSRDSDTFMSAIAHLDSRIDLYKGDDLPDERDRSTQEDGTLKVELGNRALIDLCIMASKLAYENENFVRNVVLRHWKMHFVDFFNCWNDYQKKRSTQVFILCDKSVDTKLILISFRGTSPFDANDWCTDFDFSWYEIPKVGKVHMGFLEALGLGDRTNINTFQQNLQAKGADASDLWGLASTSNGKTRPRYSAYYEVRSKLKSLLKEHKNAKFVVTGHSLGGALAILFPTLLLLHEEMEMLQRLLGVYTFGQPRVGDRQLRRFIEDHMDHPYPKYFRVVYCNDVVPRIPSDNRIFLYKHFGICLYYDSCYAEKEMEEEPNRNFLSLRFLIPMYMNAVWELIRGLTMGYTHGPEYKEGWFSILLRIIGLALPGVAAHSPRNYVNSVRLGKKL